jgi:hypothetical protein
VYRGSYGGSPVAAKVVYSQEAMDSRREFDREFRALATLHHPNVVAFFGVVRQQRAAAKNAQKKGHTLIIEQATAAVPDKRWCWNLF